MSICLRRREFIAGLGGAAFWSIAGSAQQRAMAVVGWLSTRNSETDAHVLPAFRRGLNRQGYVEGRNVTIKYRWSDVGGRAQFRDRAPDRANTRDVCHQFVPEAGEDVSHE
jgi:hypothetical protein